MLGLTKVTGQFQLMGTRLADNLYLLLNTGLKQWLNQIFLLFNQVARHPYKDKSSKPKTQVWAIKHNAVRRFYTILKRWGTLTFMSPSICAIYFNINIESKARLVKLCFPKGLHYLLVKMCNIQATSAGDAHQSTTAPVRGTVMMTQESQNQPRWETPLRSSTPT